jgi:membrane peptidoglycan carboxypeptidase
VQQEIQPYPSLVLGAVALSPMEVNQMYLPIANQGLTQPLSAIRAVVNGDGSQLYQHDEAAKRVTDPQASWLTLFAMTKTVSQGTARARCQVPRGHHGRQDRYHQRAARLLVCRDGQQRAGERLGRP